MEYLRQPFPVSKREKSIIFTEQANICKEKNFLKQENGISRRLLNWDKDKLARRICYIKMLNYN